MPALPQTLSTRFNQIADRVLDENFLRRRGQGNEISFHVFDYPPECELALRAQLEGIERTLHTRRPELRLLSINLFDLVVDYLKSRNLWEKALEKQRLQGDEALKKALAAPLKADRITDYLQRNFDLGGTDVIFLWGAGSVFPMLRSHSLLSNLHAVVGFKPLVLFFPGGYDGGQLQLFGLLPGDNYYRAFRLVP